MPIYEEAGNDVAKVVSQMMKRFHGPLEDAGTSISVLFARATVGKNGEKHGPALVEHGYPIAASIRVVPYKQRVAGLADAEITIDGDRWDELSEDERDALVDHQLQHLEIKKDKDGNIKTDDLDRPKLYRRLHDHQFGWFDAIARRHGPASIEVQQFKHMIEHHRQLYFEFDGSDKQEPLSVGEANDTVEEPKKKRGKRFSEPAMA